MVQIQRLIVSLSQGVPGGKLRETIQNLFQTPFEGNHGRRFYISAKRSTQMNRKTTKKVDSRGIDAAEEAVPGAQEEILTGHIKATD